MFPMSTAGDHSPLAAELNKVSGLKVKMAEPLARYTSMKVGGSADYYAEAENDARWRSCYEFSIGTRKVSGPWATAAMS